MTRSVNLRKFLSASVVVDCVDSNERVVVKDAINAGFMGAGVPNIRVYEYSAVKYSTALRKEILRIRSSDDCDFGESVLGVILDLAFSYH